MRAVILSLVASITLFACGSGDDAPTGFIRLPADGAMMTAAYLTVTRDSDDRLINAEIEGVERIELHTNTETDGVMRMRRVEGFEVKAGEPLVLAPRGDHLMLIGLDEGFEEGEERKVTLIFESGAVEVIELPVRRN
ncbi:copper chaperone PCu(A)C [Parvularcula lutaonensis]|uniref:Copper chaperone PCu(A)C n=1 Tax=Parvularcula lutaonensis TaxID=491923 RepID=A0ABV7MCV8_9PROT|nr:copper chaperone PCu(A)C [Parvularcula lutaonensis]GGY39040.1 hypothetical protein GCM10007148_04200 [Parvularcula lutaonensis]